MLEKVRKRDGKIVKFNTRKIAHAIQAAAKSVGGTDMLRATKMARQVAFIMESKFADKIPSVEDVQDTIEDVLVSHGCKKTAKAFILYRERRSNARSQDALIQSTCEMFDSYIDDSDWMIKENASMQKSVNGLNNYVREKFTRYYWLNEVYPAEVKNAHESGDLHLHDLGFFGSYCAGWSLEQLLIDGFGGVENKVQSKPAKHLRSFLGQIVNSTFTTQGECAGAQAWSSIDTYCAPFIRRDKMTYAQVKQAIQEFVYNLNVPTRVGFQCPFSNLTFDLKCPSTLANKAVIIGGEYQEETYKDFQKEMDVFNKAFCEVMAAGDADGRVFAFPIPTLNVTKDFPWGSEAVKAFMEVTRKYGLPYFANYVNSELSPEDAVSMCCFSGDTKLIWKQNDNVYTTTFEEMYAEANGKTIQVRYNDEWKNAKPVRLPSHKMYRVSFANGESVVMTDNHITPTSTGDKRTDELTEKDFVKFNSQFVGVENVEEVPYGGHVYCVECEDETNPYFELANGLVTHNCRLRLDTTQLRKRGGGLFGSNPLTGSIGVVTINLPRIGYLAVDETDYLNRLREQMEIAKTSLEIKRKTVESMTEKGMYPYCQFILRDVKARSGSYWFNHFSTIGLCGMHESLLNLYHDGEGIASEQGRKFAIKILEFMRSILIDFQEETGHVYNLEATPAESTGTRFAILDKQKYEDIIQSGEENPYYTNSSNLPVGYTADVFKMIEHQDAIQTMYTGGTVAHLYLAESFETTSQCELLIKRIFENYKMPYISITPTFSVCKDHKYIPGKHEKCPTCGKECEVYSRITGFIRPVKNWNVGKKAEWKDRQTYVVEEHPATSTGTDG